MKYSICDLSTIKYQSYHDTVKSEATGLQNKAVADSEEDTTIAFRKSSSKIRPNMSHKASLILLLLERLLEQLN